jgi:hypothetical protein
MDEREVQAFGDLDDVLSRASETAADLAERTGYE